MTINVNRLIGNTPCMSIDNILIKCEFMNLTGSIKDRTALYMLSKVPKNHTIMEATSGNTGISLAALYSALGFSGKCIIYLPITTSKRKVEMILKYGATVVTCKDIKDSMTELQKDLSMFNKTGTPTTWTNQFDSIANLAAQTVMAKEIEPEFMSALDHRPIYYPPTDIVVGIGTSGTLAGLFNVFPSANYHTFRCIDGAIEGTSDGVPLPLKPRECNLIVHDITMNEVITVKNMLRFDYGIDIGYSSAANFVVAQKLKGKRILTIFADRGDRYE
ncbi:MAG: pyridoxal-phosphate dependent enzyme [Nitrosopumilales archaeon]|nr:MAG: pyridoxal-phosphate dependent enzyme [Nitrosopumilales archaeon]